jgi:aminopeptidase YwaD
MRELVELLEGELSGARAQEHVAAVTRHYRSPGSAGYHAVIDYVESVLEELGIARDTRSFPLDGATEIGGDPTPLAWEPAAAVLELLPGGEVLANWSDCASCLPWWCRATPREGIELTTVDVGTGESDEDYVAKDVQGKAVILHDSGENFAWSDVVERAARHGAAAIVTNYLIYQYEPWRTRGVLAHAVQQMRLSARSEAPWTFTVSDDAFQRLLQAGRDSGSPPRVRLTIDARTFEGTSRSVVATIRGASKPDEAVLFVAHVTAATMPGANCASGVALLLELAGTLTKLIADGRLRRPERSIKFMFANEGLGSIELAESDPSLLKRIIAAFAFCSVGHDQGKTKSSLVVGRAPDALPTFVNDLVEGLIGLQSRELPWAYRPRPSRIPYTKWQVLPYTPWSDNVTWSKMGVPGLLFMSLPDRYFHTQLLTVEETDPQVFVSCGAVTGAAAYLTAAAGWPETARIMRVTAANAERRLGELELEALAFGPDQASRLARALDAVDYFTERDIACMRSAIRLVAGESRDAAGSLADELERRIRDKAAAVESAIAPALGPTQRGDASDRWTRIVPATSGDGAPHGVPGLTFLRMTELVGSMSERDPSVVLESLQVIVDGLWSRCDGVADLARITRDVGHEFDFDLAPEHMYDLARGLERAGYIALTG